MKPNLWLFVAPRLAYWKHRLKYLFYFADGDRWAVLITPLFGVNMRNGSHSLFHCAKEQSLTISFLQKLASKEGEMLFRYEWTKLWWRRGMYDEVTR